MIEAGVLTEIRRDHERRGFLRSTIEKRQIQVKALGRWMATRSIFDATRTDIESFLDSRDICARSRYTWLASLHVFFTWAVENGHMAVDPTAKIIRPRLRRMLPRPIRTADLRVAVASAEPMMRCWLLLAALQGLRCQEIAGLRREDILMSEHLLRIVHAKGGHERVVPLHPDVERELASWLTSNRGGWMFPRPRGGAHSPNQVSSLVSRHLRDCGVGGTAHQLRHWFGTFLYSGTRDLRLVQEMMGHSTPQTTAVYVKFDWNRAGPAIQGLSFDDVA